jgi:D-glucosaminate-6-phosphate ammonia-lyase
VTGFYHRIGVRRVVNAATTLTAVGGSLMPAEVLEAMNSAASQFVDIHELHDAAGRRIAELTNNEAAHVTSGCGAAIVLAVLACATGGDPAAIMRMPGGPAEVVVHAAHRIPYDPAIGLAGARIVQVGNVLQTFGWELDAAIGEHTAAVFYVAGAHLPAGALSLADTIRIAHARGVPVIVDAAAQLPPHTNLWHFTRDLGADLVLFSGGKGLRGPQASGLMVGRASLIAAARANASPNQRLARAMKAGKEEIAGLVTAVELYLARDHAADHAGWQATVDRWIYALDGKGPLRARAEPLNEAGQPVPRAHVTVEPGHGVTGDGIRQRLWDGDPRVHVLRGSADSFYLSPDTLAPGEEDLVTARILEALTAAG